MPLDAPLPLFLLAAALSLAAWSLVVGWVIVPRLRARPREEALLPLVLVQAFRHVSILLMLPGVVGPGMPEEFVHGTVAGDVLTAVLALAAAVALRARSRAGVPLVWVVTVVGGIDLIKNVAQGVRLGAPEHFGAAAVIPTMLVPLIFAVHVATVVLLLRRPAGRPAP